MQASERLRQAEERHARGELSRQRLYQIRNVVDGRCQVCGKGPIVKRNRCAVHVEAIRKRENDAHRKHRGASFAGPSSCGICQAPGHNRRTCPENPRRIEGPK